MRTPEICAQRILHILADTNIGAGEDMLRGALETKFLQDDGWTREEFALGLKQASESKWIEIEISTIRLIGDGSTVDGKRSPGTKMLSVPYITRHWIECEIIDNTPSAILVLETELQTDPDADDYDPSAFDDMVEAAVAVLEKKATDIDRVKVVPCAKIED